MQKLHQWWKLHLPLAVNSQIAAECATFTLNAIDAIQCHLLAKYLHLIPGVLYVLPAVATTALPNMWSA